MITELEAQILHAEGQLKLAKAEYSRLVDEKLKIENQMITAAASTVRAEDRVKELKARREGK